MSCLGRMLPQTIRMDGSRPPIRKKLVTNNYNPTFCRNRLYRLWIKLFYGPSTQVYRNSKRINVHQKYKKENNAQIIMEQQPQLNDHNKQEYPPMHTEETYYLVYKTEEQKNRRTNKKYGNRKSDKNCYSVCL